MIMRARSLDSGNLFDVACDEVGRLAIGGITLDGSVSIDMTATNSILEQIRQGITPPGGFLTVKVDPSSPVPVSSTTPIDVKLKSLDATAFPNGLTTYLQGINPAITVPTSINTLGPSFSTGLPIRFDSLDTTEFPNGIPVNITGATSLTVNSTITQAPGDAALRVQLDGQIINGPLSVKLDAVNLGTAGIPINLSASTAALRVTLDGPQAVSITGNVTQDPTQFNAIVDRLTSIRDNLTTNTTTVGGISVLKNVMYDADGMLSDSNPLRTRAVIANSSGVPYDSTNRLLTTTRLVDASDVALGTTTNRVNTSSQLVDGSNAVFGTTSNRINVSTTLVDASNTAFGTTSNRLNVSTRLFDSTGLEYSAANPIPTNATVTFPSNTTLTALRQNETKDENTVPGSLLVSAMFAKALNSNPLTDNVWKHLKIGLPDGDISSALLRKQIDSATPSGATSVTAYTVDNTSNAFQIPVSAPLVSLSSARVVPADCFGGIIVRGTNGTSGVNNAAVQPLNMNQKGELIVGGHSRLILRTGVKAVVDYNATETFNNTAGAIGRPVIMTGFTNGAIPLENSTGFIILQMTRGTWSENTAGTLSFCCQFNNHPNPSDANFNNYWFSTVEEHSTLFAGGIPAVIYGRISSSNKGNYVKVPILGRWVRPMLWMTGGVNNTTTFELFMSYSNV